ncbi:solute carrier family 35 member E1 homolog isoform X3 [Daktulosphaira vitifoliae]|uniref:solute carrier family 35 member E1 homolog isoform X3 n=1 Tax=Daktulosphaira vitifoliae TaxID=58002 RepID=UPI0021AAB9DD|nr:solute carrier family 35 member E1 homolog isoform X3 [Daktulosphaira vitifoliae]
MVLASKEIIPVLSLCCFWYLVSSGSNVVGKTLLNQFPYPMTVTMVQLLSITIYSGPFFNLWGVRRFVEISWPYYFKLIVPLALGKFIGSVFTHVSLWKVPVSFTHTVKATMPLFSVVLSRIILGEKQTLKTNTESYKVLGLLIIDGILNWLQNILAFSVMSMVTSLTYAVASSSKRIFVVGASLIVLGNPVTLNNICGMALALFGVMAYNKAKYDARENDKKRVILPMTNQNLNNSKVWLNGHSNTNGYKSLFV